MTLVQNGKGEKEKERGRNTGERYIPRPHKTAVLSWST